MSHHSSWNEVRESPFYNASYVQLKDYFFYLEILSFLLWGVKVSFLLGNNSVTGWFTEDRVDARWVLTLQLGPIWHPYVSTPIFIFYAH